MIMTAVRSPGPVLELFPGGTACALSTLGKSYTYSNYGNELVGWSGEN